MHRKRENWGKKIKRRKLSLASKTHKTDSSLLLEVMASNTIIHVNRSHSLYAADTQLKLLLQKRADRAFTHGKPHSDIKGGHRQTHFQPNPRQTGRQTDTDSFRLTTTHQPPLLPAMCLRLPRSAPDTFRLMHSHPRRPPLSLPPSQPPPSIKSQQCSLCKSNTKTKYLSQKACEGLLLLSPQHTEQHPVDRKRGGGGSN